MNGNRKHLREVCEGSLRRLKVEHIDLYQLHRIDPQYPAEVGFIPWSPINAGNLKALGKELQPIASHRKITTAQLALAWLLWRSPVMLPIPGTSKVTHLEENLAATLKLEDGESRDLGQAA